MATSGLLLALSIQCVGDIDMVMSRVGLLSTTFCTAWHSEFHHQWFSVIVNVLFSELASILMSLSTQSKKSKKPKRLGKVSAAPKFTDWELDQCKEFYLLSAQKNVDKFSTRMAVLEKEQQTALKNLQQATFVHQKAEYELCASRSARFPMFADSDLDPLINGDIDDLGELALDPQVESGIGELARGPLPALDWTPFLAIPPVPAPTPTPAPASVPTPVPAPMPVMLRPKSMLRPKRFKVTVLDSSSGTAPSEWFSKRSYVYQFGPPSSTCTSATSRANPLVIDLD